MNLKEVVKDEYVRRLPKIKKTNWMSKETMKIAEKRSQNQPQNGT